MKKRVSMLTGFLLFSFLVALLTACGNKTAPSSATIGTNPAIAATLFSFPTGSAMPANFKGGIVTITDANSHSLITSASATMNGVSLAYNAANLQYEGNVSVAPGGTVSFSANVGGTSYSASITQFASYPMISLPTSGTYLATGPITVSWSGGSPAAGAVYAFGVLNSTNPSGQLDWPLDNNLEIVSSNQYSSSIPANSLSAGDHIVLVCIAKEVVIPSLPAGSYLGTAGCRYVPITVN